MDKEDFEKEIDLVNKFCGYLEELNLDYKKELRKRDFHNEGYFDLVVRIGKRFHGIEAKLNNFTAVFKQSAGNRVLIAYSWILYNKRPSIKSIEKCKDLGIGLIIFMENKFSFLNLAKKSCYINEITLNKIKRNWNKNKINSYLLTKFIE